MLLLFSNEKIELGIQQPKGFHAKVREVVNWQHYTAPHVEWIITSYSFFSFFLVKKHRENIHREEKHQHIHRDKKGTLCLACAESFLSSTKGNGSKKNKNGPKWRTNIQSRKHSIAGKEPPAIQNQIERQTVEAIDSPLVIQLLSQPQVKWRPIILQEDTLKGNIYVKGHFGKLSSSCILSCGD